ncbi:hypothetical protein CEN39_13880 [Fischerella thermalis CCMEE 5201]|jgi:hypothetical protein|nr:hypothetical protein CEN39_13880 [Fischerella thermalis CCMEE 5201]
MSSNQSPNSSNQNRLYTRLITILRILQFIGYFIVILSFVIQFSIFRTFTFEPFYGAVLLGALLYLVISCIIVYTFTEVLIAIIDLLSRIEKNTRP